MTDLHSPEATAAASTHRQVRYRDRQTGDIVAERVPGESLLRWLYGTTAGSLFFRAALNRPLCSRLCGWWQQSSWTRRQIRPFTERYRINLEELEHPLDEYTSFNDFFIRRLKPTPVPATPTPSACSVRPTARSWSIRNWNRGPNYRSKAARSPPMRYWPGQLTRSPTETARR